MTNPFNTQKIEEIRQLAMEAGEIAKDFFRQKNFSTSIKSDNSKVTSADIAISEFLSSALKSSFGDVKIICEEGNKNIENDKNFFLIDPIDGTSSFVKSDVQFCINIAFIADLKPVFGLIYAPLFEGGKMVFNNAHNQIEIHNIAEKTFKIINKSTLSEQFQEQKFRDNKMLKIITSARSDERLIQKFVKQFYPQFLENYCVEKLSSAIKFIRILEGRANLYVHFKNTMEWDTASGHALINNCDLSLKNLQQNGDIFFVDDELQYKKNNFINGAFVIFCV